MHKRYIVYVTQAEDGTVERVAIPMKYVYVFVIAAVTGMVTIVGMAGSYSRLLVKAETINGLRDQLSLTRKDYAHLEKKAHDKDVQAASLGSLANEVSAIYGLTTRKLSLRGRTAQKSAAADAAKAPLRDETSIFTDETYFKSLDTFYALKSTADAGLQLQTNTSLGVRGALSEFTSLDETSGSNTPDMWPILGPITSGFGQREDPILGNGEGEFHKGVDISAVDGTPIHAPAGGRVVKAGPGTGYGREVMLDHGNGIVTVFGHLQGFNVVAGQNVVKGEVIGYSGHSGRAKGSHLHYEVQIHGTAVNPHKYLRTTMAQMGSGAAGL